MTNFQNGDLVVIKGYAKDYDGNEGTYDSGDDDLSYIVCTKPGGDYYFRVGQKICMHTKNLCLVDNSKSFIPEDWS